MKVLVDGYWNNNLGDDLFLKILVDSLPNNKYFIIINQNQKEIYDNFTNLNLIVQNESFFRRSVNFFTRILYKINPNNDLIIPGSSNYALINMIQKKDIDCYLLLGGSLFIFPKKGMDSNYASRKKIANTNIPFFIIGSNFGPFYYKKQLNSYYNFFKKAKGVTFREKYSYSLFSDLGKKIKYYPDVVFGLDTSKYQMKEEYILFSIIDPSKLKISSKINEKYFEGMCNLINKYISSGEKVVLMSFCEPAGDLNYIHKISKKVNSSNLRIYNHSNIDESLQVLANAKKVIATRYHAMILSWIFQKEVFVISYSNKTSNVINDFFPDQNFVNISDISTTFNPSFSKMPLNKLKALKQKSKKHFNQFSSFTMGE